MNAFATAVSIGLQYGVPLDTLVRKFAYMRFEPEGYTGNPEIPFAKSMPDYIMRWLASRYGDADLHEELGILTPEMRARKASQEAIMRGDTAGPAESGRTEGERKGNGRRAARRLRAPRPAGRGGLHRRAPGDPGQAPGPRARPGMRDVRRHDAAHGLVLHVLELREQHGLRLSCRGSVKCLRKRHDLSVPASRLVTSPSLEVLRAPRSAHRGALRERQPSVLELIRWTRCRNQSYSEDVVEPRLNASDGSHDEPETPTPGRRLHDACRPGIAHRAAPASGSSPPRRWVAFQPARRR